MSMKTVGVKRSQVIRAEENGARQWTPPQVGGEAQEENEAGSALPTAADLEELASKAHQEGFEQGRKEGFEFGHREGIEAGRQEIVERVRQFDQILHGLSAPFEALDEQVEQEVVTLVIAMVRQLLRREIKTDPAQIVGVVREALNILPVSARHIRVLLHPEDAELIREAYALGESDQKWQVIEDPVVQRGGCRIHTENSQVDATLESRLQALIAPLLGTQRESGDAASDSAQ